MPRTRNERYPRINLAELATAENYAHSFASHPDFSLTEEQRGQLPNNPSRSLTIGYAGYLKALAHGLVYPYIDGKQRTIPFCTHYSLEDAQPPVTMSLTTDLNEPNNYVYMEDDEKEALAHQLKYVIGINPIVILQQLSQLSLEKTAKRHELVTQLGSDVVRAVAIYTVINNLFMLYPDTFYRHSDFAVIDDIVSFELPEVPKGTTLAKHVAQWHDRFRTLMSAPKYLNR